MEELLTGRSARLNEAMLTSSLVSHFAQEVFRKALLMPFNEAAETCGHNITKGRLESKKICAWIPRRKRGALSRAETRL
jgi:hypothetical protein